MKKLSLLSLGFAFISCFVMAEQRSLTASLQIYDMANNAIFINNAKTTTSFDKKVL